MNQALRQMVIVGLAPFCVLVLVVRAQEVAPPPASVAPAPVKEEATSVQAKDDPAKTNDAPPVAAEAPVPAKDETAPATKESPPVKDESSVANSAPAPAPAAPVAAEVTPVAPEPVKPAQETVAQVPPAAPAPAPEVATAAPAAPEPEKPAETASVSAPPAPAPDVAPVAATVTPPAAVAETVAPAVQEAPAPSTEATPVAAAAPVVAEAAPAPAPAPAAPEATNLPAAPEPVKPTQETVAQVVPAAPAPAPEVAATLPAPAPAPEVAPVAPAVTPPPEGVAPVAETVAPAVKETPTVVTATPVAAEAAPAVVEPVKPVEATAVVAAPVSAAEVPAAAPVPDSAPVAATISPPPAVVEPAAPATKETPAPSTETPTVVAAEAAPAPPAAPATAEPVKPVESSEATVVAAPIATPEVPVAAEATPAAAETVKSTAETVAQVPPESPAPAPEAPATAPASVAPETATETVTPVADANSGVAIDHFEFSYGLAHPALPELTQLQSLTIRTTRDGNVFRGAPAGKGEILSMVGIPAGSRFDADALRAVAQEVVRWYNSRGLYGVWVAYSDLESSAAGLIDNRPADSRSARIVVWASQVAKVRTLARGKRIKAELSIDNKKHRRIAKGSPLHPGKTEDQPGSLFNQEVLNNYLYGLSLHPGRRVEASIASFGQPGKVVLDYLVNETKAWQLFSQVNNYGTTATGEFRGRLGYQDNQLTNHDDILNVDVISTPNAKTYGAFLSYRIPLWRPAKVLMRIYGSYGDFLTQANGGDLVNLIYAGKNWQGGMEFTNRLSLWHDWQLQSSLGANYNHYGIQTLISSTTRTDKLSAGDANFLVPFIGLTLSHDFTWGNVSGGLHVDHTVISPKIDPKTGATGLDDLGRRKVDAEWTSARWNLNATIYLDSLFHLPNQNLVHEFTARLKGRQLLRGMRLIPHEEEPLGGALSVRGYAESALSADEFVAATFEYAYHLPRAMKPADEGKLFGRPFKWRPRSAGQNPDWDLALRAFFDYAYRSVSLGEGVVPIEGTKVQLSDQNLSMAGTGVGVSLQVKQNFSLRLDYGMALTELRDDTQEEGKQVVSPKGNSQLYFISTFTW